MHTADLYNSGCSQGSSSPGSDWGLVDGRQSFICIIVNTEVSYLSNSFTHIPSLSMTLRAPTCSNESPTPMMGESFKTILSCTRHQHAGREQLQNHLSKNGRGLQTLFERSWAILRQQSLTFKHCHNTCCPTSALCSSRTSMKISSVSGA